VSIDQQFVEFVIKSLVTKPEAVQIERRIDEKGVLLELTVDPEDLGRVIGKRGATAQSVRTLLRALGTKNDARYNLKIVDNGVGGHSSGSTPTSDDSDSGEDAWSSGSAQVDTTPADDDDVKADDSRDDAEESDVVAKTRRELRDLDDLDV
jgi:uncharacterized protein